MNIDELTVKQIKEIASMAASFSDCSGSSGGQDSAFIGKYVLVRCRDAGVHCGVLRSHNGRSCTLVESRRLDRFKCAKGDSCTAAATYGIDLKFDGMRVQASLDVIMLTESCEIIPMTKEAEDSVRNAEEYKV